LSGLPNQSAIDILPDTERALEYPLELTPRLDGRNGRLILANRTLSRSGFFSAFCGQFHGRKLNSMRVLVNLSRGNSRFVKAPRDKSLAVHSAGLFDSSTDGSSSALTVPSLMVGARMNPPLPLMYWIDVQWQQP
jgi:hypothetical protein